MSEAAKNILTHDHVEDLKRMRDRYVQLIASIDLVLEVGSGRVQVSRQTLSERIAAVLSRTDARMLVRDIAEQIGSTAKSVRTTLHHNPDLFVRSGAIQNKTLWALKGGAS